MNRSLAVARMHLVDRRTIFAAPAGLLALVLAINLAIWCFVPRDGRHTGGVASIYIFVICLASLAVVRGFPFALGMGSSRRAFSLGTALVGGLVSVVFGTVIWLLGILEEHTGGWGVGGHFFSFGWLSDANLPLRWLVVTMPFLAMFALGGAVAAVFLRWRIPGLFVSVLVVILLSGLVVIGLTWRHDWHNAQSWFTGLTPLTVCGWLTIVTLTCGLLGWSVLRRTSL